MAIATPLETHGRYIVDAHGKRVRLAGVNWYGASEDVGVPAGLDCVDRNTLATLIAAQGFNCVRFPFSIWMTRQTLLGDRRQRPVVQRPLPDRHVHRRLAGDHLIHQIDLEPLIICEGLSYATDLTAVASHPVTLAQPGKVVYSMHDYSWSGHPAGQTQAAYLEQMNKNGGYLLTENIAPLWIGEFGDTASALSEPGTGQVQNYWGAPEPYGLLTLDWTAVGYPDVVAMLEAVMAPRTGPGVS